MYITYGPVYITMVECCAIYFQSVRGKRGFSEGIHQWEIRELPFYSSALSKCEDDDDRSSAVLIGVGTSRVICCKTYC